MVSIEDRLAVALNRTRVAVPAGRAGWVPPADEPMPARQGAPVGTVDPARFDGWVTALRAPDGEVVLDLSPDVWTVLDPASDAFHEALLDRLEVLSVLRETTHRFRLVVVPGVSAEAARLAAVHALYLAATASTVANRF